MGNTEITFQELRLMSTSIWEDQWFLLTSGDFESHRFNSMTISWGSIGVMWSKPFVQVAVRPTRYTFEFMNKYPDFSVCAFPKTYHKALELLGAKSGRDGDKIAQAKISPCKGFLTCSPVFVEANLIFECRKIYSDIFRPQQFIDQGIKNNYKDSDYHTYYYGEILTIFGDRKLYT